MRTDVAAKDHTEDDDCSNTTATRTGSPLKFILLVFALSVPFWLIGAVTGLQLLPGLPLSALAAFCPAMAATILVHTEIGPAGVIALWRRAFDYQRITAKAWYVPIVLLMPGAMVLSYALMRLMGMPLPNPQLSVLAAVAMFLAFFLGAVGEEIGWSGYIIDPLQARWTALEASVLLGLVWAAWHVLALVQAHRAPAWMAWWCLGTVAQRVLIVWLYNNTGKSVFAAILFHDTSSLSWQLFPNYGSHYDPRITGLLLAFTAAVITLVCGPRTLARCKNA
jgi:CAAX protease family protein